MTDIDVRVGRNVAALRQKAGLSTLELANMIGMTIVDLTLAEAGRHRLRADDLFKISQSLKVPIGAILGVSGEPSPEDVER